jgi:LmbE family N-acetylglucosaminyl deacetylase
LIFSPHPDDEVIIGGLPLRLLREPRMNVINVAVTLGSRKDRQAGRWKELQNSCSYIGFGLTAAGDGGLEGIHPAAREEEPQRWSILVKAIADLLTEHRPSVVFFPHAGDWNKTHIGVHHLVISALESAGLTCQVVETEFWGAMDAPNLTVESSAADVADLVAALSLQAHLYREHGTLPEVGLIGVDEPKFVGRDVVDLAQTKPLPSSGNPWRSRRGGN